jgi:GH15 family glucan-1,4-alpha-glucosidase
MRADGYLPIAAYATIGDGRTVALIGLDGSIDWLCLPNLDSPSVFGGIVDARRGGAFTLAPAGEFSGTRRYLPGTNVLETSFDTATGRVRITDALTLPDAAVLTPFRELARRVECLTGRVRLTWRVQPRFGHSLASFRVERRGHVPVAVSGADAVAIHLWGGNPRQADGDGLSGQFELGAGERALLAFTMAHQEPLVFPTRDDVERRLDATATFWTGWSSGLTYTGPWRDAVIRSALAMKMLVFAPSGAIAAAATTSLPEVIGGPRNWDYRFCWIRDSTFTIEALLHLGCLAEARAFFWWFMHATRLTRPRLRVFHRLDGGGRAPERTLPLEGYRGSRPVRIGNAAESQRQLDVYGTLLDAAWLYAGAARGLDGDTGRALADVADHVCDVWRQPDHGIWEVRMPPAHFIHSKVMCWVALDRALRLTDSGYLSRRTAARWRSEADAIRSFVDTRGWSDEANSYVGCAGERHLDAALLMLPIVGYLEPGESRANATLDAIRRELGDGPFVYRYASKDGIRGDEGAFLTCSFWLVNALVLAGRQDEAASLMEQLLGYANDVGLYSEEIDPATGEHLGNFPQALVHLALVNAAAAFNPRPGMVRSDRAARPA